MSCVQCTNHAMNKTLSTQLFSCECPHCVSLLAIVPPQGCEAMLIEILKP